jgi:hypothetical protein
MLYRIETKSTGDKILSAFSPFPIISMIGGTCSETISDWIVVEYDNPKEIIPNKSWDAKTFYNQTCVE